MAILLQPKHVAFFLMYICCVDRLKHLLFLIIQWGIKIYSSRLKSETGLQLVESLYGNMHISRAWESVGENISILVKRNIAYIIRDCSCIIEDVRKKHYKL